MHSTTVSGKILAIFMIVMGVGTFLGVIANASEIMLNNRERLNRINKSNMIIGTFFSEVGTELIIYLSNFDHNIDELREELIIDSQYSKKSFTFLRNILKKYHHEIEIEIEKLELTHLRKFLIQRRDFLLHLLENSNLLEHEYFTD